MSLAVREMLVAEELEADFLRAIRGDPLRNGTSVTCAEWPENAFIERLGVFDGDGDGLIRYRISAEAWPSEGTRRGDFWQPIFTVIVPATVPH